MNLASYYDPTSKEVYLHGVCIGHVVMRARVAAGRGVKNDRGTLAAGTRAQFYTAVPLQGNPSDRMPHWRPGDGGSIGTRFERQMHATDALALFYEDFVPGMGSPELFWTYGPTMKEWRRTRKLSWGF